MWITGTTALTQSDAAVSCRVPPLQHIALRELNRGMTQDLLARKLRPCPDQRQHVL
jgi:hypothetical protein